MQCFSEHHHCKWARRASVSRSQQSAVTVASEGQGLALVFLSLSQALTAHWSFLDFACIGGKK